MTQIFVLNRLTVSATAKNSMFGTQVLRSLRSDIYLLKINNIQKMTPNMFPHKLLMEVLDIINSLHRATYASVDGLMMHEQDENSVIYNNSNTLKQATLSWFKKKMTGHSVCTVFALVQLCTMCTPVNVSDFESITSK